MAYTIIRSDGTTLTTIADGTINTTSTSLSLPGRNYAGYGQSLNTNGVRQLENYANTSPPPNPLRGQFWFDTTANVMRVCPADGTSNAAAWLTLSSTGSGGTTTFGAVSVTGNLTAANASITASLSADVANFRLVTVSSSLVSVLGNFTTANIGTLRTTAITSGGTSNVGTLTGTWTVNNDLTVTGNTVSGVIKTDNYQYANGVAFNPSGTYGNANVAAYLPVYTGNISATKLTTTIITAGANTTAANITGNWTLTAGSRLNASYADLAERFAADDVYDAGTVVELGGLNEITKVNDELSERVFGVVSGHAAYLMNSGAGDDLTHPPIAVGGRVPVKVVGRVNKGDRLVSAGAGVARAATLSEANAFNTIGRSLVDKASDETGVVEAFVKII